MDMVDICTTRAQAGPPISRCAMSSWSPRMPTAESATITKRMMTNLPVQISAAARRQLESKRVEIFSEVYPLQQFIDLNHARRANKRGSTARVSGLVSVFDEQAETLTGLEFIDLHGETHHDGPWMWR